MSQPDPILINKKFLDKLKGMSKDHPLYKEFIRVQERIKNTKDRKAT